MTEGAAIRLEAVRKLYPRGHETVRALDGVSAAMAAGEFVAVTGPSGCGKSTLLHLIGAIDLPSTGAVWVDGRSLATMTEADRSRYRRETVGIVYQSYNLLPYLTAWENVALPLALGGVPRGALRERVDALLDTLGLTDRAEHWPQELSGGEMQRVAVARAVIARPRLILADEPTGNLDSTAGREVLTLLRDLNQRWRLTLILATHSRDAAAVADRVLPMKDGRVVS